MRFLLLAVGLVFAALFGLSATVSYAAVDFKHPTVALQTVSSPIADVRTCTPSTAQADSLNLIKPMFDAGTDARPTAKTPSATPGGASLGVGTEPVKISYT